MIAYKIKTIFRDKSTPILNNKYIKHYISTDRTERVSRRLDSVIVHKTLI